MSERRPTSAALVPAPDRAVAARIPAPLWYRPIAASAFQRPPSQRWLAIGVWAVGSIGVVTAGLLVPWPVSLLLVGVGLPGMVGLLATSTMLLALEQAVPLWRRARMWVAPLMTGAALNGQTVRFRGTIQPQASAFEVPGGGTPGVFACTHYFPVIPRIGTPIAGQEEIRGVPFQVQSDDGRVVRIDPYEVRLLNRHSRLKRMSAEACHAMGVPTHAGEPRLYGEAVLRPGDRVELVGRLERKVTPDGAAAPGRGVPTELWMRPALPGGVWIRR
jgi:hypothetical protein